MEDMIIVRSDASELEQALSEIQMILSSAPQLLETLPGFFKGFVEGTNNGTGLFRLEQNIVAGASEVLIAVKPSKRLLKLLATLRKKEGARA